MAKSVKFSGKSMPEPSAMMEGEKYLPTAHVSHPDLPDLEPGQTVMMKGKVKSSGKNKDSKSTDRHAHIEIHELTPGEMKPPTTPKQSDEDDVEKGLADAEKGDQDDE